MSSPPTRCRRSWRSLWSRCCGCAVPDELVVVGDRWKDQSIVLSLLGPMWARGWRKVTLVHRERPGIELACARWWGDRGGRTRVTADPLGEVKSRDPLSALIFVQDLDPLPVECVRAAERVCLPVILKVSGRYPHPPR